MFRGRLASDATTDFLSVHPRKHQVQQDERWRESHHVRQPGDAIVRHIRAIAGLPERVVQQLRMQRFVFNDLYDVECHRVRVVHHCYGSDKGLLTLCNIAGPAVRKRTLS